MAQRIELMGAGLASAAALLWLVYVIQVVQALSAAIGATGQPFFNLNMGVFDVLFVCSAALIFGVSVGAYLHVVHRRRVGAVLLWLCAGLLILDLASYDFSGWSMLPVTVSGSALPLDPSLWTGITIPTILPILEVLATSFAVVAVLASLTPVVASVAPAPQHSSPGGYAVPRD